VIHRRLIIVSFAKHYPIPIPACSEMKTFIMNYG
jgi:hypothetical protein